MIDIGMYVALGFLLASLLALMVAPAFWRRAVRLTKRRVEMTMPEPDPVERTPLRGRI